MQVKLVSHSVGILPERSREARTAHEGSTWLILPVIRHSCVIPCTIQRPNTENGSAVDIHDIYSPRLDSP